MVVAYLINQYPQPSQSFIRREIAALEAGGIRIERFTVRRWKGHLVEPADIAEQRRTRVVLDEGIVRLGLAVLGTLVERPMAFGRALRLDVLIGRRSERGLLVHLAYLAEACVLRKWLRKVNASHLHAHFGTNSAAVAMLCRELGGPPFSFTCHGPEEFDSPRQLSLREKVRRSAFTIAISQFGRSQLLRWSDAGDWPKIHIVHCVVDSAFLNGQEPDEDCAHSDGPSKGPALVSIGRLVEQKGHALLLQAAALLREEGLDFSLTIIGDGRLRPALEEMIELHGLRNHVKLSGWGDAATVRRELRRSRALVVASFAEGLPVVIMEALALGRPVVSTRIAGIPELVEPGACGWLVVPGSVVELADAMRSVLTAPDDVLQRMGADGAARVARWHNGQIEAAKLAALFEASVRGSTPAQTT